MPLPTWATRSVRWSGPVPTAVLTVPILPVADLATAVADLRALGFTVTESAEPPTATASWRGW
jgi:hypothetical protein